MKTFKGFDKNLKCRDFQYKIGKTYKTDEKPKCCKSGFHSCENPIDVFGYYPPANSRFCETETDGAIDCKNSDTKIASSKIKIKAELSLKAMVEASIKFVFEKCDWSKKENCTTGDQAGSQATGNQAGSQATGDQAGSQATGYQAGSQATGDRAGSQATGNQAGSQATGDQAGSQATGDRAGSQATGDRAMSTTNGHESTSQITNNKKITSKNGTAIALGVNSKVKAPENCWLVLSEWDKKKENILKIKTAKVDNKKIKADTWYNLKNGKFVEAEQLPLLRLT